MGNKDLSNKANKKRKKIIEKKRNSKRNTTVHLGNLKDDKEYCSTSEYKLLNRFKLLLESSEFDDSESY